MSRAGGTGGDCSDVLSVHVHRTVSNPFLDRGTEVEMLCSAAGACAHPVQIRSCSFQFFSQLWKTPTDIADGFWPRAVAGTGCS